MGKGGGGGGSQTVNTQVEPPDYAKPFLEFGLAEAKDQYMSDMPGYYPGSTVVGFAPESQMALNMVRQRALDGSPLISGAQNTIKTAATGGYVNPALAGYGGFARGGGGIGLGANVFRSAAAGGMTNEALPFARGLAGGANLGEAIDMTRATARGDFLSGSPGLQGAIDRALDPVQDRIQSQFARAGRMGSGANQEVLTKGLSDVASDIAYQDYSRERQNQLAAQQNLAGLQSQQFGTQLSGLNALGSLSGQDLARRMSGASALSAADQARMQRQLAGLGGQASTANQDFARRMQGAQLAPQFADLDYQGAERLAAVGSAREQQAQAELQDQVNRFNFDQNIDAQKLNNFMALIGGGTVGSNQIQPVFRNPLASGLGGALSAAQLGSMIAGPGQAVNPAFAVGGGLLGLMGG
ncbi:Multidrug/pheromone exporter [uncultured Mediterranean phage uvMED]|nr:Multidrug/pheromone exporter [uncultured Mediterranean phage uvMED]